MQQPTPHELQPAEVAVLAALARIARDPERPQRYPQPVRVAAVARMTYAATIGAIRQLAYAHNYVTTRRTSGRWEDGISITTTGQAALDAFTNGCADNECLDALLAVGGEHEAA